MCKVYTLNMHAHLLGEVCGIKVGLRNYVCQYFMYAGHEGTGETALMPRLILSLAGYLLMLYIPISHKLVQI